MMRQLCHAVLARGRSGTLRATSRCLSTALEQTGKHEPFGADGSGYYSDNTKGCYDVIKNSSELVLQATDELLENADATTPFVVADYGTADGGTSMPLMYAVVSRIRAKCPNKPIFIWYEDQAQNDFKSLFLRLHKQIDGPASYLEDFENVFCMASGTTFYQQCFPDESVDLAFSATAMHWLTSSPCQLKDVLHSAMATGEDAEKFKKQAAGDWETILMHRAKELKTGGAMVIVNFAKDENDNFLGQSDRIKENMHGWFRDIWSAMAKEGKITEEEFRATNFPNQYRTVEECRLPFDDPNSSLSQAGMRLASIETQQVPCPYNLEWVASGGDAAAAAKTFVPTTRTWSNSVFLSALSLTRSAEEREALVDEMYGRYEAEVAKNPANHAMDYVHSYIRINKV